MFPDLLLGVALVALLGGVALLIRVRRLRARLGMPPGEVIYQDTAERLQKTLYSRRLKLAGRPDYVQREGEWFIPVEVKTGRTPGYPYPGQVMQCIAYCALVEETFGVRPPHGVILFEQSGTRFVIDYTPARERELRQTLRAMRWRLRMTEVHRSHDNPQICAACGYRDRCDERLV
ncbi:MAG: Dna2/Cas4 domain-containing protein [Anaerolineae bacterium]|nr:Dna2/Cas4 domain-containing protein [Anaerolineae bacterium]